MDFSNFWWGGGKKAEFAIEQSLRFRGAQNLKRTFTNPVSSVRTLSFWAKRALDEGTGFSSQHVISFGTLSSVEFDDLSGNFNPGAANAAIGVYDGFGHHFGDASYRDPSGWYHVVTQWNGTSTNQWVNGRLNLSKTLTQRQPSNITIGSYDDGTFDFKGYMADVYFIDGAALEPTTFAAYTEDGVWAPLARTLPKANPVIWSAQLDIVGGINDNYTPDQLFDGRTDTYLVVYDDGTGTPSITFGPSTPIEYQTLEYKTENSNMNVNHNGVDYPDNSGQWITIGTNGVLDAASPIVITGRNGNNNLWQSGIRVDGKILQDGAAPFWGATGFHLDFADPDDLGKDVSGNGNHFEATGFNTDSTSVDYDLMFDSPTQNYATSNPLNSNASSISNANLKYVGGSNVGFGVIGSQGASSGKFYWETVIDNVGDAIFGSYIGVIPSLSFGVGASKDLQNLSGSYTYRPDGNKQEGTGSGNTQSAYGNTYTTGDIISVALDMDNGAVYFAKNGVWQNSGDPTSGATKTGAAFTSFEGSYTSVNAGLSGATGSLNYGQKPLLFTPPAGFKALQTQKLPKVPIKDGREHFQVITAPGDGLNLGDPGAGPWSSALRVGSGAAVINPVNAFDGQTGTHAQPPGAPDNSPIFFEPDGGIAFTSRVRVWANTTADIFLNGVDVGNAGDNWVEIATGPGTINTLEIRATSGTPWLNAVEVDNVVLRDLSILTQAQQTFPNSLIWIKDRVNSNQHQLVDSVRGSNVFRCPANSEGAYAAPSGSSVAWCWKAGDSVGSNLDGNIFADVSANVEAGFSIIKFTGNGPDGNAKVGHGLGAAPEFVIVKPRFSTDPFWVYHVGAGANNPLKLDKFDDSSTDPNVWREAPDQDVINIGSTINNGGPYMGYAWTSKPGYSAFGVYQGSNDPDGPYITTNFRPAFVMYKNVDGIGNWVIHDTTRDIANPTDIRLAANTANSEGLSTSMQVDILSNGFKLRSSDPDLNANSRYLYVCFAEHPFGGSNVSPANAR